MKALLFFGIALCCCHTLFSQDTVLKRNYYLKASIWEPNQTQRQFYVADITDTEILLVDDPIKFRRSVLSSTALNYQKVDVIRVQRKGSIGRGLLKGSLGGLVLGGLVGAITYRKCDDCWLDFGIGLDIIAGATIGVGVGSVVGLIAGVLSGKRFIIHGNKEKFDQMRLSVLDMAYRKSN